LIRFAICNETFAGWSLERICSTVRSLGYEGLELAPYTLSGSIPELSRHERANIRQTIEQAGLETVGLHWLLAHTSGLQLTSPDPQVRTRTAAYLGELARLCCDLGGKVLVLGSPQQRRLPPGLSRQEGLRFATDVVNATIPALEANHMTLAIEPLAPSECNFLSCARDAVAWIECIAHPCVRLQLDAKAMSQEVHSISEIIREHARWLAHFHANDPNLLGPGMGELDFAPILSCLQQIGYDGWVSVEVFATGPGPEQIAAQSIQYLRGTLDQPGGRPTGGKGSL
jgi:sugar phosphate isomerase/epimerase